MHHTWKIKTMENLKKNRGIQFIMNSSTNNLYNSKLQKII
jgi:hypothetical protein